MHEATHVEIEHGRRRFTFQLNSRELDFGPAGIAPYFWMDSRLFRRRNPGSNFRACIDWWWNAVEVAGAAHEFDNEVTLVWAECYPLFSTARTLQDVYLDAHLHTKATRELARSRKTVDRRPRVERDNSLTEKEVHRLRRLATSHDVDGIRSAFERLFLRDTPARSKLPQFQEAARSWLGNGIKAWRQDGRDGLRACVSEIGQWTAKYRKQGGQDDVRRFVNFFGYTAKVAFYRCYASAWAGLVQKLVADHRVNTTAARFLRMWHNQNQPADDAAETGGNRDVFCGQVLALHPLSAIVQNDPQHLEAIGRWLSHRDYDRLHNTNRVHTCSEYWDVVTTILIAAHEYYHGWRRWQETRGQVTYAHAATLKQQLQGNAPATAPLYLEDMAAEQELLCPTCKSRDLVYRGHKLVEPGEDQVRVTFLCGEAHEVSVTWTWEQLRSRMSVTSEDD